MSLENQVIVIFAGTNGFADKVPLEQMRAWEVELLRLWRPRTPRSAGYCRKEAHYR
jgi:F0F1-type ATP synthase alpha subunit